MSTVKKIVVFGSTGQTGLCCLDAALKKGLDVTVLVRNPSRLPEDLAAQVKVIQGDSTCREDVAKAVDGQDGVVVALGTGRDLGPTTAMSDSVKIILKTMMEKGIKKISVCLSTFLFRKPADVPAMFLEVNADHQRMLDALKAPEHDSLDWIAVLPPHISKDESSCGKFQVDHGSCSGRQIPKSDLGQFLVDCLDMPEHSHQQCGLAYPVIATAAP